MYLENVMEYVIETNGTNGRLLSGEKAIKSFFGKSVDSLIEWVNEQKQWILSPLRIGVKNDITGLYDYDATSSYGVLKISATSGINKWHNCYITTLDGILHEVSFRGTLAETIEKFNQDRE